MAWQVECLPLGGKTWEKNPFVFLDRVEAGEFAECLLFRYWNTQIEAARVVLTEAWPTNAPLPAV